MSQKLSNITPTYHSFAKNQVLTHKDLNEVIDYFEDQERLSRISLSGVGIVCGFKPSYDAKKNVLKISQGAGVTTDGDLVYFLFNQKNKNSLSQISIPDHLNIEQHLGKSKIDLSGVNLSELQNTLGLSKSGIELTVAKSFDDTNVKYDPFIDNLGKQIQLLELLPSSSTGTPLSTDFFLNRSLILYVDCYSKEPGACTTISCDSQGIEEVRVIRVLAVNDSDLDVLQKYDSIFNAHNIIEDYLDLKDVAVPRVVLSQRNTDTAGALSGEYYNTITGGDTVANLTANLTTISGRVGFNASALTSAIDSLFIGAPSEIIHYQYRYDLLKDLVDSYDELRDLFMESYPECCPDINSFPKHLMLGKLSNDFTKDINNRHDFYPSPILTNQYSSREHLVSILGRMVEMVNKYTANVKLTNPIKVTPSKLYKQLGERSVPFYYDPQYDSNNESSLVRIWDFKRRTLKQYRRIQGYHQSEISSIPSVSQPLQYSLDDYDFFRIEGHQGKLYNDALEEVNRLRDENALPFDTKMLGISVDGSKNINIAEHACSFEDIQGQLDMLIDVQNCVLSFASKFLSGYSITNEGGNNKTTELMGRGRSFVLDLNSVAINDGISLSGPRDTGGEVVSPIGGGTVSTGGPRGGGFFEDVNFIADDTNLFRSATSSRRLSQQDYTVDDGQVLANFDAQQLQDLLAQIPSSASLADLENVIVKNLCVDDNDLGSFILDGFQRYVGTNTSATYDYIESRIDALRAGSAADWSTHVASANLYFPAKILTSAYAASLLIPKELTAITSQLISNYNIEINRLCSYARQWKTALSHASVANSTKISTDTKSLSDLLNQSLASMCCAGDKLQSLLDQVNDRKTSVFANLELSKFIEKHPAMEHKAGVPSGGTFVMVYALDAASNAKTSRTAVQNGVVVADFALPYMCCSDCSPINFIVPRKVISLLLSKSSVCVDLADSTAEDILIDLTISPSTGVVATTEFFEGVTVAGNKVLISPSNFNTENIGKPIEFTVDGQFTNATLVVTEKRDVNILTTPTVDASVPSSATFYTFYADGANINDDNVVWDFGDGTPLQNGIQVSHTFKLPVEDNPVTVKVRVTPKNGRGCTSEARQEIRFDDIVVSLNRKVFCINEGPYPFTIIPEGATAQIDGPGVTSDMKSFNPSIVSGAGTYTIEVENQDPIEVQVIEGPKGQIRQLLSTQTNLNIKDLSVIFQFSGNNYSGIQWSFQNIFNPDVSLNIPFEIIDETTIAVLYEDFVRTLKGTYALVTLAPMIPAGETTSPCSPVIIKSELKPVITDQSNNEGPDDTTSSQF